MTPQKTPVQVVTIFLLSLLTTLSTPFQSVAQCTGTIQSTTYSTTFTGTGNATYSVDWPQYNPPGGYTLISTMVRSVIDISAAFQITNPDPTNSVSVRPGVTGEDLLQVNGNDLVDAYGNSVSDVGILKNLANYIFAAGETRTIGPLPAFINYKIITDSIASDNGQLNDFVGNGTMHFTYSNSPGYTVNAIVNVTPSYSITTRLSMTYYYCFTGVLSSGLLTFTATPEKDGTVLLNWISAEEQGERRYVVQVSNGSGNDFQDVNTQNGSRISGNAAYSYTYTISPNDKNRLYFRVKVLDAQGTATYSQLRIIDLDPAELSGKLAIYPNPPSDYINVVFPFANSGWQVDILTADGSIVQRNLYSNTGTGRVNFNRRLSAGTYFIRATELQTARSHSASFIIR
jgi:hypothetical protein